MNLPRLPQDKANHLIYGATIAIVAVLVSRHVGWHPLPQVVAVLAALGAGILKEISDAMINKREPGAYEVSAGDVLATAAGGVLVAVVLSV